MGSSLTVRRFRSTYRVPREQPAPANLRQRLDRVARDIVPARVADALADELGEDRSGLAVIRWLALRVVLGFGVPPDSSVAASWSRAGARAVTRALALPSSEDWIVRFGGWPEYMASYLDAVAAGAGATRWYYEPFSAFSSRPPGQAIHGALLSRPDDMVPALAVLARRGRLAPVLRALGDPGAWSLFEAAAAGASQVSPGPEAARLRLELRSWPRIRLSTSTSGGVALLLLARVSAEIGGRSPAAATLRAIRAAARIVPLLWQLDGAPLDGPLALLSIASERDEESAAAAAFLVFDQPKLATALLTGDDRSQPCPSLPALDRGGDQEWVGEEMLTEIGGAFLLLPGMAELDLPALLASAGFPVQGVPDLLPVARWLVLAKAAGPEARVLVRRDPGIALAAGLDGAPSASTLEVHAETTASVRRGALGRAVEEWARATGLVHLHRAVEEAEGPSGWVRVIRSVPEGLWLFTENTPPGARGDVPPEAEEPPPARAQLAHLSSLDLIPDAEVDLVWTHIAALVLHLFARQLTGFQRSTAAHLARNFLLGPAHAVHGPAGVRIQLPAVPLQLVLRMGGWQGTRFEVPWLPGATLLVADDRE